MYKVKTNNATSLKLLIKWVYIILCAYTVIYCLFGKRVNLVSETLEAT